MKKKNFRDYKVNGKQYVYILDAICPEMIDIDSDGMSDKDKVELVLREFDKMANYPYNKKRCPNHVERFKEWLQGLPSVINVAFENYAIIQIGKEWGYCQTEKKSGNFVNNWFEEISSKFFQLARLLDVDVCKYV